ncbi:MAG: ABC transporter ATP-binding protein, partial [bacterium]
MSDIAVVAENIGKQYRIGAKQGRHRYRTLRETIGGVVTAPYRAAKSRFHRFSGSSRGDDTRMFWALRHISLEVAHGQAVGVIGRNGAGKSTLLKILCRVTEPTEGRARLHGRAGSLLEVGTGFHPELSGRENVYLNGAILGMGKREIDRKFDEIVAFAETERFLDTQVKHYSTEMYMRLAFAVAAHLEPEILLIDEVLAVGDSAFQKKCVGKMGQVTRSGRTILFVSHNMQHV